MNETVQMGMVISVGRLWFGASLVAQMVRNLPAMQETRVWSLGWEDPLEKEMATHCSILAWEIPWMEEPGRLQSMGLQRVGHNWATNTHTCAPGGVGCWLKKKSYCFPHLVNFVFCLQFFALHFFFSLLKVCSKLFNVTSTLALNEL